MASKVLSIEVGANVTRICLTDYKVKNPKVYKYTKVATPEGVFTDGEITVTEELVSLLKSAISENKMNCKQVVFPITSSRIASREITIPLVKEKKIDAMVHANASDYFPIDLSQYELGYILLGTDYANNLYRLQVLAAPQSLLENYKQLAGALGMQMVAADYSGNSIYQMVKGECREGGGADGEALAHGGGGVAHSVQLVRDLADGVIQTAHLGDAAGVIGNESIVLQRTVPYGVDDAVQTILDNRAFGVSSYDEALKLAIRKTCMKLTINARDVIETEDTEDDDAALLSAKEDVASSLEMLINGVARIMDYYTSRNNGETVDKIFITGIGSDFSGLSKLMTNELGVKTVGLKHLEGQTLEKSFKDGMFGEYIACVGAVIAPVGLVGTEKGGKAEGKKGSGGNDFTAAAYLLLIGGTFIAIVLIAVSILNLTAEKTRYNRDVQRLNDLAEIRSIYDKYSATQVAYDQVEQLYAITENHNEELLAFISEMEEKMPTNIRVQTFSAALDNVTMNIEVNNKEEMANAVQKLRNFDTLANVTVMGVTDELDEEGGRTVTFTVSCIYKTMEQMKAEAAEADNN